MSVGRLKKDMAAAAKRQRQQLEEQAQLEWLARDRLTAANTGLSQLRQVWGALACVWRPAGIGPWSCP